MHIASAATITGILLIAFLLRSEFEKDFAPIQPDTHVNLKRDRKQQIERLAARFPKANDPAGERKAGMLNPTVENLMEEINENRVRAHNDEDPRPCTLLPNIADTIEQQ